MERTKIVTGILELNNGKIWLGFKGKHKDWTGPGGKPEELDIYSILNNNDPYTVLSENKKKLEFSARLKDSNHNLDLETLIDITTKNDESKIPEIHYFVKGTDKRYQLLDLLYTQDKYTFIKKETNSSITQDEFNDLIYRNTLIRETPEEIRVKILVHEKLGEYPFDSRDRHWMRIGYRITKTSKTPPNVYSSDTFTGEAYHFPDEARQLNNLAPRIKDMIKDYIKLKR